MGDKIYIDTELLRQISSQLSQVHHSLSAVHQKLGGSVSEVRGVVSDQVGLINVLSSVQGNTQKAADYTERLAKAVNNAAARWEEVERQIANQQLQGSEAAPQGAGVETGAGTVTWFGKNTGTLMGTWIGAGIGSALGGPVGLTLGAGIGARVGAANDPGTGLDYAYKYTSLENFAKNPYKYFYPIEFGENSAAELEIKNGNLFAKGSLYNTSLKTKGQVGWNDVEDKDDKSWKKSGDIGVSAGIAAETSVFQLENGIRGQNWELTNKNTLAGTAASGEVALTLFKDGKLDPQAYLQGKAEAYLAKSEISGKYGTEDLNLHAGAEVSLVGAGAEGKAGYFRDEHGNKKWGAEGKAEAYWAKEEIKMGVNLYGVKIDIGGEAMLGVNASAGATVGTGSASGQVGLGPFKGKVNIDWSDPLNKFFFGKP